MFDESPRGRLAQRILEEMDPETKQAIKSAPPEMHEILQGVYAKHFMRKTGQPYGRVYKALGWVIAELTGHGQPQDPLITVYCYEGDNKWPTKLSKGKRFPSANC